MITKSETKIIDPEFAFYGLWDLMLGCCFSDFEMAYFAQPDQATSTIKGLNYQSWILDVMDEIWQEFTGRFSRLWSEGRIGILNGVSLFEDQRRPMASAQARAHRLQDIRQDAIENKN